MANLLEQGLTQGQLAHTALAESATNRARKAVADIKASGRAKAATGQLAGSLLTQAAGKVSDFANRPPVTETSYGQPVVGSFDRLIGALAGKVFPGLLQNRRAPSLFAKPPSDEAPVVPNTPSGAPNG